VFVRGWAMLVAGLGRCAEVVDVEREMTLRVTVHCAGAGHSEAEGSSLDFVVVMEKLAGVESLACDPSLVELAASWITWLLS